MKQLSFRKYTLLGLVLLAASAVTAAVVTSKDTPVKKRGNAGHLQPQDPGPNADIMTCISDDNDEPNCTSTNSAVDADSDTTFQDIDFTSLTTDEDGNGLNTTRGEI